VKADVAAGVVVGVTVGSALVGVLAFAVLGRLVRRRPDDVIVRSLLTRVRAPGRVVVPLVALDAAAGSAGLPGTAETVVVHVAGALLVVAVAWLVVRTTYVFDDLLLARYRLDAPDNLRARRVHTQVQVLRRVTAAVVSVLAIAVVLLGIPEVRAAGIGLLASAGLVGVVGGIAARPTASNLVAGLQIAISQPIRVDDVVVVDGHWGRVEEIALTYVVVRVWDLRRLVVPVSYFVSQPFENWTRSTADILGWVHLEVDYTAPVDAIRTAFREIVAASPNWDGKVATLQVTGLGTETMQLRALMSSPDSSRSWDLQCEVRERLVAHLQEECPWALPRLRTERAVDGGTLGTVPEQ
jgi:small-conductance mechanosensitive channel